MANNNIHINVTTNADSVGKEFGKLGSSVASAANKTKTLDRAFDFLDKSVNSGKISLQAYSQIVDRLDKEETQLYATLGQTTSALKRQGDASVQSSKHMSRGGVAMQQFGYQAGDFIVQVQSGQNAMVAFGQQATQMVGALYMLPPAVLAGRVAILGLSASVGLLIASLGIIVPLATAVGAAFMRTREESKSFEDSLSSLKDIVSDLSSTQDLLAMSTDDLESKYGAASAAVREYAEMQAVLREGLAKERLSETVVGLGGLVDSFGTAASGGRDLDNTLNRLYRTFEALEPGTFAVRQAAVGLARQFEAVKSAEGFEQQKTAVEGLITLFDTLGISLNDLPNPVKQMLDNFIEANASVAEAQALIASLSKMVEESSGQELSRFDKIVASQAQQLALATQIFESGKDSEEVAELRARQEGINKGLVDEQLDAYIATELQIRNITEGISESADETSRLAKEASRAESALRGLQNIGSGIARGLSMARAELVALNNEASTGIAKQIAGRRFDLGQSLREAISGGADRSQAIQEYNQSRQELIEYERTLLAIEQEKQRQSEITTNTVTSGNAAQIEGALELTQAMQDQISVFDTMDSAMESGFMSMVDGTKTVEDSFRDMAKSVVAELYRVYVLQKMIGGLGVGSGAGTGILGGIQGALGLPNIPSSSLDSYEGGGYTGSGPRSGGMDGRGGYLAMLHPRETVVDHTKAGSSSGGGVTVVQNFNFQANGDDSVKKLIAQAAPQIANMAKQSVVDSRRRGGAMKNAFG